MKKPEWKEIIIGDGCETYINVKWCKGCGVLKITQPGQRTKFLVPRRERERRIAKKQGE